MLTGAAIGFLIWCIFLLMASAGKGGYRWNNVIVFLVGLTGGGAAIGYLFA